MLCYVDYTCGYSYRAWRWLTRLGRPVEWRTFSLKEANRGPDEPPAFASAGSLSILALGLAHAARAHDFDRYHAGTFEAFHGGQIEEADLLRIASDAGVETDALDRAALVEQVAAEHAEARARWKVFGTPTLILDDTAVFLRLRDLPAPGEDAATWHSIETLAGSPIDLLEIVRP